MAGGAGTSAMRRRQRRLRSWLRHERQTVAMELAAALHHCRDARSEVAHEALRGQKTASSGTRPEPLEEVSEPQVGAVTVGHVPLLSGAGGRCGRGSGRPHGQVLRRKEVEEKEEGVGDGVGEEGRAAAACHRVS